MGTNCQKMGNPRDYHLSKCIDLMSTKSQFVSNRAVQIGILDKHSFVKFDNCRKCTNKPQNYDIFVRGFRTRFAVFCSLYGSRVCLFFLSVTNLGAKTSICQVFMVSRCI